MIPGFLYSELFHLMEHYPDTNCWRLADRVIDWFSENDIDIKEQEFITTINTKQFGLIFDNDEDAIAFKLRWI